MESQKQDSTKWETHHSDKMEVVEKALWPPKFLQENGVVKSNLAIFQHSRDIESGFVLLQVAQSGAQRYSALILLRAEELRAL